MKIVLTEHHKGKSVVMDEDQEIITVYDSANLCLGTIPIVELIELVIARRQDIDNIKRRQFPRTPLTIQVRYTTPTGKTYENLTAEIGSGGLFIESGSPLPPGTELTLSFALPDKPWQVVSIKATVRWIRTRLERIILFPGMGIQFVEMDPEIQAHLTEFIEAVLQKRS